MMKIKRNAHSNNRQTANKGRGKTPCQVDYSNETEGVKHTDVQKWVHTDVQKWVHTDVQKWVHTDVQKWVQVPVVAGFKARVCGRSLAEIASSNPTRGIDARFFL